MNMMKKRNKCTNLPFFVTLFLYLILVCSSLPAQSSAAKDLSNYDWTKWLVGTWKGTCTYDNGEVKKYKQSFDYTLERRWILAKLEIGENGEEYKGMGLFFYNPETGESVAHWAGLFGDYNEGRGKREGDKIIWNFDRLGRRYHRVFQKINQDEYHAVNTILYPDGRIVKSKEIMKRVI
jgi:hypothetical protein